MKILRKKWWVMSPSTLRSLMMMAFRNVVCALNSLYYFPHSRDFISRHTLHVVILVIPRRQFIWGFAKKMWPATKITFSSNWFCKGFLFEARLLFCYILSYFVVESRDLSIGISIIFFTFSILDTIQYYSIQFKTEFLFHFSMN